MLNVHCNVKWCACWKGYTWKSDIMVRFAYCLSNISLICIRSNYSKNTMWIAHGSSTKIKGTVPIKNTFFLFQISFYRCTADDIGFPTFGTSTSSGAPAGLSMPYLKSSPYIMTVDTLHSMGYPGKFIVFWQCYHWLNGGVEVKIFVWTDFLDADCRDSLFRSNFLIRLWK